MTNRSPAALLSLMLVLGGCADPRPQVRVTVTGLSDDIRTLDVALVPRGHPALPARTVSGELGQLLLKLPAGLRGPVQIQMNGLLQNGCTIASGEATLTIREAGEYRLRLRLKRQDSPGCLLRLGRLGDGEGSVVADAGTVRCAAACEVVLPPGESVRLRAQAAAGSYFAGWSGACNGAGLCELSGQRTPFAASAAFVKLQPCTKDGWCLYNPLPRAADLHHVWGSSPNAVWAVGSAGTILFWNGTFWVPVESGTRQDLYAVWGSGPDDVWASGDNQTLLRWDGMRWNPVEGGRTGYPALWGSAADDVWIAGSGGSMLHWDGTALAEVDTGTVRFLYALWGSAADDVWAAGYSGTLLHWDGSVWAPVPSGTRATLTSLWGTGPHDVWATGTGGTVLHFDGSAWTANDPDGPSYDFLAVWGTGPKDVWVAGVAYLVHWDGATWSLTQRDIQTGLFGLWGTGSDDVFAVGDGGAVLRWNGNLWVPQTGGGRGNLHGIWGSGPADIWAVGEDAALHWDGTSWQSSGVLRNFNTIGGARADDVWALGNQGKIAHFDGVRWSPVPSPTKADLVDLWVTGLADIWAVGNSGTVLRWDGAAWTVMPGPASTSLHGVWASAPDNAWVCGSRGLIAHWDGKEWSQEPTGIQDGIQHIWGSGPGDVWFVGVQDLADLPLFHWDGSRLTAFPPVTAEVFNTMVGVWGSGPRDVWAAGTNLILHWDGTAWHEAGRLGTTLVRLWGSGPGDVWAVGYGGAIIHHRN